MSASFNTSKYAVAALLAFGREHAHKHPAAPGKLMNMLEAVAEQRSQALDLLSVLTGYIESQDSGKPEHLRLSSTGDARRLLNEIYENWANAPDIWT